MLKLIFKSILIIIFLFGAIEISQSQTFHRDSLHFTGIVYDASTLSAISEVHIIGEDIHEISSTEGDFSIWARTGDTVQFSHIAYKNAQWIISDTIKNPDMMVGIFLVQDTVNVAEVVIYPRLMSLESMLTQPIPQDKDIRNAKNNLKIMGYQARNNPVTTWDAEMNQKYSLRKAQMGTEYAGLIPPDEMVNFTAVIPLAFAIIRQKYNTENKEELKITSQEENVIKSLFLRKVVGEK
jgi:hypothetical protein